MIDVFSEAIRPLSTNEPTKLVMPKSGIEFSHRKGATGNAFDLLAYAKKKRVDGNDGAGWRRVLRLGRYDWLNFVKN